MYYILGTDYRLFWNVSVPDPRHKSEYYLVLGCLRSSPLREPYTYLGRCKRLPLQPPTTPTREGRLFAALRGVVPKPKSMEAPKNVWIPATTWILVTTWIHVDERVSARQDPAKDQSLIQRLGRAIASRLKGDWRRHAYEAGK